MRPGRSGSETQILGPQAVAVAVQDGHASLHSEARLAGVARVEIERCVDGLTKGLVGVAKDNHVRTLAGEAGLELLGGRTRVHDVVEEEFAVCEFDRLGFLETEAGVVGVAQDGSDRSDGFQLEDQPGKPDVAGVKNVVHAGEELWDFGVEEIMGVGDDADFHAGFSVQYSI